MSVVGELDVYGDKLYIELHNFDFLSFNNSQTTSTNQITYENPKPTLTTLSEKRSLMYQSLFENTKAATSTQSRKRKQPDKIDNLTPPTDSTSTVESDPESRSRNKQTTTPRRQLRSKKIAQLASDKLNLPSYEES